VKTVDKLLLTPQEAAEALSIGRSKLYELLGEGQLESVRVGSCRRIPIGSLIDFVGRLQDGNAGRDGRSGAKTVFDGR
jgi:excisionase family DNA binding protein